MLKSLGIVSIAVLSLILFAGGPPSKGTPPDKRLKENKPGTSKPKTIKPAIPQPPKKG